MDVYGVDENLSTRVVDAGEKMRRCAADNAALKASDDQEIIGVGKKRRNVLKSAVQI